MTVVTQIGRAIIAIMTGRMPRVPNTELVAIDTWLEEDEYLASFPNQWTEATGWRWWRAQ